MIQDEYSPFKFAHHQDKLAELRTGIQPVPLQVQIVLTNKCQHNCSFCAYRQKGYMANEQFQNQDQLSQEKIYQILGDFINMGVNAVHYTGGGEPLLYPDINNIFIQTLNHGLELALVTNGELLNDTLCKTLSHASWIRISVDAASPVTFKKIRQVDGNRIHKVIDNIETLVKYKKDNVIGVGFVLNKDNYKEVYEAAKFYKELGADNFRISAAFTPDGFTYFNEFYDEALDLCAKAESLTNKNFRVFNLYTDRVRDLFDQVQDYNYCPFKEISAYIGADSNVYTCCTLAYTKKGCIGSIKDQSFRTLWGSDNKWTKFKYHNPSEDCQLPCLYKAKNEFINYCLKDKPKHINFI